MSELPSGDQLPKIVITPPGPESRRLTTELRLYESPNVTFVSEYAPIVWREAVGANVRDVDDNLYIDMSSGFGVAAAGHRNPDVMQAIRDQTERLVHGLGDVHPSDVKIRLLKRLAEITPGDLSQTILASSGAEAVEAALKTARLASGRPGVLAFSDAYHGLTYGTLAVTDGETFRGPFLDQLGIPVVRAPFPDPYRPPGELEGAADPARAALKIVAERLDAAGDGIGAVIVEPIQGRAGVIVPPPGFLAGLRDECDRRELVLIFDEIFTGLGRTGSWFACDHERAIPDLLCLGKALTGGLPFSACIGRRETMAAWPVNAGDAIHTSTFLGHPLGCVAAIAQLDELDHRDLIKRSAELGQRLHEQLRAIQGRCSAVGNVRGRGLLAGIELVHDSNSHYPDPERAARVAAAALRRGVILLADGRHDNVLTISPPLSISERQLDVAVNVLEDCLAEA